MFELFAILVLIYAIVVGIPEYIWLVTKRRKK